MESKCPDIITLPNGQVMMHMDGIQSLKNYPDANKYFKSDTVPNGEGFLYLGGGYTGPSWSSSNVSIAADNALSPNKNTPGPRTVSIVYVIVS